MSNSLIWDNEEFFPDKSNYQCPPLGANIYAGFVFRFCHESIPCKEDFKLVSSNSKFREKHKDNYSLLCQGSGLSSYLCFEDAEENLLRMKKKSSGMNKRFKGIGKVKISENDGVIKETPSKNTYNHHTWWKTKNSKSEDNFSIISVY